MKCLCPCGYEFPEKLGVYGCPNCEGDSGPAAVLIDLADPEDAERMLGPAPSTMQRPDDA